MVSGRTALVVAVMCWTMISAASIAVPCCSLSVLRQFIANSSDGTTFLMGAGTWTGCPMMNTASPYNDIQAGNRSYTYIGDPAGTIVDCEFAGDVQAVNIDYQNVPGGIAPNKTISFQNLVFTHTLGSASAIRVIDRGQSHATAMSLTIYNSTFHDLGPLKADPVVFFLSHGNLTIDGCLFYNINNGNFGRTDAKGGAILSESTGGVIIIRNTQVYNSTAGLNTASGAAGGGIFIGDPLSINGTVLLYNVTVSGCTCSSGGGVSLKGQSMTITVDSCSFVNNVALDNGGGLSMLASDATVSNNNYTFRNTIISGNTVTNGRGAGASLRSPSSTLSFVNVTFGNNVIQAVGQGGAMAVLAATGYKLAFTNVSFVNNIANFSGGGVSMDQGSTGSVAFSGSTFSGNSAPNGGGVYAEGPSSLNLMFSSTTFSSNVVLHNGGGIFAQNAAGFGVSIYGCTFQSSTATDYGGGLFAPTNVVVENTQFLGNSANCGGGIHFYGGNASSVVVRNSQFVGNSAGTAGGGVAAMNPYSTYVITNAVFAKNTAIGNNGAGLLFRTVYSTVTITNSNFYLNSASVKGGGGMQIDYCDGSTLTLTGLNFTNNLAFIGGAMLISEKCTYVPVTIFLDSSIFSANTGNGIFVATDFYALAMTIQNTQFLSNVFTTTAFPSGGGMMAGGTLSSFALRNTSFINNTAQNSGGGFYGGHSIIACAASAAMFYTFDNATFDGNAANNSASACNAGGGLWLAGSGGANATSINVTNSVFRYHSVGAMAVLATGSNVLVNNCQFLGNSIPSSANGAGLSFAPSGNASNFIVRNSQFIGNSAGWAGGGIAAQTPYSSYLFEKNVFSMNTAIGNNGAGLLFRNVWSVATISNSIFSLNSAVTKGGAGLQIDFCDGSQLSLIGLNFTRNVALVGAGILMSEKLNLVPVTILIDGAIFSGNANEGLSVCNFDAVVMTVQNTQFIGNSQEATGLARGGGLYFVSPVLTVVLRNTSFIGNSAAICGGGLFGGQDAQSSGLKLITMDNVTFERNTAQCGAGAWLGGTNLTVNVSNAVFRNNSATNGGGGGIVFDCVYSTAMRLINTAFLSNTATNGGGVGFHRGFLSTVFIDRSSFIGNVANNPTTCGGGGLSVLNSNQNTTFDFRNSQFISNSAASTYGGGLLLWGTPSLPCTFAVTNATIVSNYAYVGGGIWIGGSDLTVTNTSLKKNTASNLGGGLGGDNRTVYSVTLSGTTFDSNVAVDRPSSGGMYQPTGSLSVDPATVFVRNNLVNGISPLETYLPSLGCTQSPSTLLSFPYNTSGCAGLAGTVCAGQCIGCPVGQMLQTPNTPGSITCSAAQLTFVGSTCTCINESAIQTAWVANNATSSTAAKYGTLGVWSPTNVMGARSGAAVVHTSTYSNMALIVGGTGTNENGTTQALDDTWLVDTTDFLNPKFTYIYGSRNTANDARLSNFATNQMAPRTSPAVWVDQTLAYLFGGAAGATWGDLWTLDLTNVNTGWKYSATGSSSVVSNPAPIYASQGNLNASSHPGGRQHATVWQMTTALPRGVLLYGGAASASGNVTMADLWLFDCASRLWGWLGGPATAGTAATYATQGSASYTNWPGARQSAAAWAVNDVVFLYGGFSQQGTFKAGYNDLWSATYSATGGFLWTWLAGAKGAGAATLGSGQPFQLCAGCMPRGVTNAQFMYSPELAAGGISALFVYGGGDGVPSSYEDIWSIQPGQGATWLSGSQVGSSAFTHLSNLLTPYAYNASFAFGSPGPRRNGITWPDHSRPGDYYVLGGLMSGAAWGSQMYRVTVITSISIPWTVSNFATVVNGKLLSVPVALMQGTNIAATLSASHVNVVANPSLVTLASAGLVNGLISLNVSQSMLTAPIMVTINVTVNNHLTVSFAVNLTCAGGASCYPCIPNFTPASCAQCSAPPSSHIVYSPATGICQCDTANGYAKQGGVCVLCTAPGLYITPSADCMSCTPIAGCPAGNVTCTASYDSHCAQCQSGLYRLAGGVDSCATCSVACPPNYYWLSDCAISSDRVCQQCSICAFTPGTYPAHACLTPSKFDDTDCEPCAPITGCGVTPVCTRANVSSCSQCEAGTFFVQHYPGDSDECRVCDVCPRGTYELTPCTPVSDIICHACTVGCAQCIDPGLHSDTCQACNETAGWGWNFAGDTCVTSCDPGQYMSVGNASIGVHAQCTRCTHGCDRCAAAGLSLTLGQCTVCNETEGYLLAADSSACLAECLPGYYPNTTASPHICHTCEGTTCPGGQYRVCTNPLDSTCYDCAHGCKTCTGPGVSLLDFCSLCDTAGGFAPSDDGSTCVPCAGNCTTCSTSPTTCLTCADGFGDPPGCAPVCGSVGCISCQSPEACLSCQPTFSGTSCRGCSDLAQIGTAYPNCVAARQTDVVSTGTSIGVLLALCIVVSVIVLGKPLPVFYSGEQTMRTPVQDVPAAVDFVLTKRHLKLTLRPPAAISGATLEGVGLIPGANVFTEGTEKGEYVLDLHMTHKQTAHFLGREMRVDIGTTSLAGDVVTKNVLAIPMRWNFANLLAIFSIVLDFVQLSSFGFGGSVQWWHKDPVPSSLHYTLIQLPSLNQLWFFAYWILAGLAILFVILVIVLKSGIDAKCSRFGGYRAVSGPVYGFIMPLVGQTLYLPIISTMLGAFACSRPVTNLDGPFVANFDESIVCWDGEHVIYVIVSTVVLLMYYPLAVYTSPIWQTINAGLDVRMFSAHLVVSGQIKFIISVTAQLFAKIPLLLSVLLIILPLPVVGLSVRRPPSIIGALHWPIVASYASVTWSGIASIIALLYPDVWFTSIVLYAGWFVLLAVSLFAASRRPGNDEKKGEAGGDALRRVLQSQDTSHDFKPAFDDDATRSRGGPRRAVPMGETVDVVPVVYGDDEVDGEDLGDTPPADSTIGTPAIAASTDEGSVAEEVAKLLTSTTAATRTDAALH